MKILRRSLIGLLLFVVLIVGLLSAAPTAPLVLISNHVLNDRDMQISNVTGLSIFPASVSLESIEINSSRYSILIDSLNSSFSLLELLKGRLSFLEIDSMKISFNETSGEGNNGLSNFDIYQLQNQLKSLPVDLLTVFSYELDFQNLLATGNLTLDKEGIELNTRLQAEESPSYLIESSIDTTDFEVVTAEIIFSSTSEPETSIAKSDINIVIKEDSATFAASSIVVPDAILHFLAQAEPLAGVSFNNQALQLETRAQISNLSSTITLDDVQTIIDSEADQSIAFSNNRNSTTKINLPLTIAVKSQPVTGLRATLSDVLLTTELQSSLEAHFEGRLDGVSIQCESFENCEVVGDITTQLEDLSFDQIRVASATAKGNFQAVLNGSEIRLSPSQLRVTVPSLEYGAVQTSIEASLENIVASFNDRLQVSAYLNSQNLEIELDQISLIEPRLFGNIEFHDKSISTSLMLRTNNQVDTAILANHNLQNSRGSLEIDLREFQFSDLVPLSSLISQRLVKGDVVSGSLSSKASITWKQQEDKTRLYAGQININLAELSGFVEDNFFVKLTSELTAEITNPLGLRTLDEQSAYIAKLDTGLAIEQIDWNYGFNTALGEYYLKDLNSEVLGGNITISDFNFTAAKAENQLAVVMTSLDLESIVDLADYPGVAVDGLISGYLPLIISDNGITIEEGLVGAINPGGTIRYTPTNPISSGNPSIQLVSDALSNYQYKTMNTEVDYDNNGDLTMEVQLQGFNPDMNGGQPINLNLNITDNIPMLLRSLRASNVITDALKTSLE